jgi:hypothetical protein
LIRTILLTLLFSRGGANGNYQQTDAIIKDHVENPSNAQGVQADVKDHVENPSN